LAGNAEGVAAERDAFGEIGVANEIDSSVWSKLRAIEPPNAAVVRLSDLPSEIERTWLAANALDAHVHASPARGVVRVIARDSSQIAAFGANGDASNATRSPERLAGDQWSAFSKKRSELDARVKQTFDPSNVLNRGIL